MIRILSEIQLLELKARLAFAQNNYSEARSNYQSAIDILTSMAVTDCPLAARLKAAIEKLPVS